MPESYKKLPPKDCVSKMISYLYHKHGDEWDRGQIIAVGHSECGVSKNDSILTDADIDQIFADTFKKGMYDRCQKQLERMGIPEEQRKIICARWMDVDGPIISELKKKRETEFPEFLPEETKEVKEKKIKTTQETAKLTTPAGQKGARPTIKTLREEIKYNPKALQLPLLPAMRAPPSQHRLQTKMEKVLTAEEKFLTQEQLMKRAEYMKAIKKKSPDIDSVIWNIEPIQFDSYNELNNVIRVPVIIAREMVQPYTKDGIDEFHFKPYDELVKGLDLIDELPIIIEHKKWNKQDIVGYVRELRGDDNSRSIKGTAYLTTSVLPSYLLDRIRQKQIVPVSIGFWADVNEIIGEYNGIKYDKIQKDFAFDHLAICINSIARCPPPSCGMNADSKQIDENYDFEFITHGSEYYNIELEEQEKLELSKKEDGEKDLGHEFHTAISHSGEDKDLTKLLAKLRDYLDILPPDKRQDAEDLFQSITTQIKGVMKKMTDSEFQEQIASLEEKIRQLEDSLKIKDETLKEKGVLIDTYEKEMKKKYVDIIKQFSTFEDSELEGKCLKDLQLLADSAPKFNASSKTPKKIQMGKHKQQDSDRLGPITNYKDFKDE